MRASTDDEAASDGNGGSVLGQQCGMRSIDLDFEFPS
jgi:hypothetical protein